MRAILRDLERRLEAEGLQLIEVGMTGTSHYKIHVRDHQGRETHVPMSGSPGVPAAHAIQHTIQRIRRNLRRGA